jgi:hypothetical protein
MPLTAIPVTGQAIQGGGGSLVRRRRLATRSVIVLAAWLLLAGLADGVTPLAAAARTGSADAAASFSTSGALRGVAATSATNAWAVGFTGSKTLLVHWNGRTWAQVPSPGGALYGVAATSASNAWAAGSTANSKGLIERWNGRVWTQVPSPTPGGGAVLFAVAARSARSVWVVGATGSGDGPTKTLVLRWNGATWG